MIIENIETKKQYTVTKEGWESLGNKQKAFKVVNYKDSDEIIEQSISNKVGISLKKDTTIKESAKDSKEKDGKKKIKTQN